MLDIKDMLFSAKLAGQASSEGCSVHEICEGIEINSTTNPSFLPSAIYLQKDSPNAMYFTYDASYTKPRIALSPKSYTQDYKKVVCTARVVAPNNYFLRRINSSGGLYPNSFNNYTWAEISSAADAELKLYGETIMHTAFAEKYSRYGNDWFSLSDSLYKFYDIFTLSGALSTDNAVIIEFSSGTYVFTYRNSIPTFELTSDNTYQEVGGGSATRYRIDDKVNTDSNYLSELSIANDYGTYTFSPSIVIAATFDMKLADGTVIVAKNADMTDFVSAV